MAVMTADDTGGMQVLTPTPKVDAIVHHLAPTVWTLLKAGKLDAALVLLDAASEEFDAAWREEFVGVIQPPKITKPPASCCVSMEHSGLDCPTALRDGLLPEGVAFCAPCRAEQRKAMPAPVATTDTGVVHVITTAPNYNKTKRRAG